MTIIDKKPALFEKSDCNIWTDSHIRHKMLEQHLDLSSDAASRNGESINRAADFIIRRIKPSARLLDLGCGPGLYASLFADHGCRVTGIDFNDASITYAASRRNDIKYISGDYIKDYPQGSYDAVVMIYCDLGTHSDVERNELLRNIYYSLPEGGVFIFDVFTEKLPEDKPEGRNWEYAPTGGFWYPNEYLLLSQTFHFPDHRALAYQYNLLTDGDSKHFIVWDRYYSEEEITTVLKNTGFGEVSIHHGITGKNDFTSNSEMFVVAEK